MSIIVQQDATIYSYYISSCSKTAEGSRDGLTSARCGVVSRPCPGGERIMVVVLWVRAELELWLRPDCERLPAMTVTLLNP